MNDDETISAAPTPLPELRDLAHLSLFAALVGAGAFIHLPLGPLHVSLQTMMIMLAGFMLGPKKAALALALYVFCGFLGLPMFGRGRAGPAAFLGPTAGYYPGFVAGAFLAGLSCYFTGNRRRHLLAMIGFGTLGVVAILGLGMVGVKLTMDVGWNQAAAIGFYAFLGGDLLKMLAAAAVRQAFFPVRPPEAEEPGAHDR